MYRLLLPAALLICLAVAADGQPFPADLPKLKPLEPADAAKAFGDRLPILPLVFRAVRLWHRTDVRGLGFDATGRPDLADLFYAGDPAKPPKGAR